MKDLSKDLFIPTTIVGYLQSALDGSGKVVLTPDWKIEKVQEDYIKQIRNIKNKECLVESPAVFNNYGFSIKINKKSKEIFVKLNPTVGWVKCVIDLKGDGLISFNDQLLDLVLNSDTKTDSTMEESVLDGEFSIAFSPTCPGIPFIVSQNSDKYGEYVRNGGKYMMFTTASLYGTKKTKNWKVGHKYMDSTGNSYTIIGEYEMNELVKDLLTACLDSEKTAKRHGNERDFITAVVEILNSTSPLTPSPTAETSKVFLYVKDMDLAADTINTRSVDVYDLMKDFTIQIIPKASIGTAYDLGEVFSKEDRDKYPIDLKQIAENTKNCFKFGEFEGFDTMPFIQSISGSYNSIVENLIYLSAIKDPTTGAEIPEVKDILKEVLEERLKECVLFNIDGIDPKVSFDNPIETIDLLKRASLFMSRILRHSGYYEIAVKYVSEFLDFKALLMKVKDEIVSPVSYIFSSWDNYVRYVNYTTLPYITFDVVSVKLPVDEKTAHKNFQLPEKEKLKLGIGLSDVLEKIINRALVFNGIGVQSYTTQCHLEGKNKLEDKILMSITFNDIKNYFAEEEIGDDVKTDILSNKFYKLSLSLELVKAEDKKEEK